MPVDQGCYALVLSLSQDREIQVGRLGSFAFPAGFYLYFGSALNGLAGRVNRHLRPGKKLRWHVDYLSGEAEIAQVWAATGGVRRECQWTALALECAGVEIPVAGFGASDCRGCVSHLVYAPTWDVVRGIRDVLRKRAEARIYFKRDGPPGAENESRPLLQNERVLYNWP